MIINGILGHPLKKPRSIKIWKYFFKKKKIKASMLKFEIAPEKLNDFFSYIKKEKNFKAMAVTMPYKKTVIKYLDTLDDFAQKAKSVNLIVKKNRKLKGYNTDIFGAMNTIKFFINRYDKIVIIGLGGTGQAIFNYLISKYKKNYFIISKKFKLKKKNNKVTIKKFFDKKAVTSPALVINCTPLGSNLKKIYINKSPIKEKFFPYINKTSVIFDIIYSPKKTILSKYCFKNKIKYFNGLDMNTLQAERALQIAFGTKI